MKLVTQQALSIMEQVTFFSKVVNSSIRVIKDSARTQNAEKQQDSITHLNKLITNYETVICLLFETYTGKQSHKVKTIFKQYKPCTKRLTCLHDIATEYNHAANKVITGLFNYCDQVVKPLLSTFEA